MIQWRKFQLKRSCIFEIRNFWSFMPFLIFIWFLSWFFMNFYSKITKKGGLFWSTGPRMLTWHAYLTWRRAGAASWQGGEQTWRAGPPADATWLWGHVAGPPMAHAWLTRVRMADTCARIYHIDYIIGYRTYKPILRTS